MTTTTVLDLDSLLGGIGAASKTKRTSYPVKYGIELDDSKHPGGVQIIHGNCMKVFDAISDVAPTLRFVVGNANVPFGRQWKMKNGQTIDSTLATWRFLTVHANCGFLIGNANTIEKLLIHESTDKIDVFFYERRQALQYWRGLRPELQIGAMCWRRIGIVGNSGPVADSGQSGSDFTPPDALSALWIQLRSIVEEEKLSRPNFNIYLDHAGFLKTYLSQRSTFKLKLTKEQVGRLHRLNGSHPLGLTTEKETRDLMKELVNCGLYTLQPEAKHAIERALAEVNSMACPIMPVTPFECCAYADEEDRLVCVKEVNGDSIRLMAGKSYNLTTGSYLFTENFNRRKVHFNEKTQETYCRNHECVLSGSDRYIKITDENGRAFKFMDRPRLEHTDELPESILWDYFAQPKVNTVAENCRDAVSTNHAILKACEMLAGYEYYPGQLNYLARVAAKGRALLAGETGTGKSLFAVSMLALKSPQRALIIAPQGSMRASKVAEEGDEGKSDPEMSAAQWIQELNKFAPYIQIWEIFSHADYLRILALNDGKLPYGVFVTYYEAFFSKGAMEKAPASWDDHQLNQWATRNGLPELPIEKDSLGARDIHFHCDSIGKEVEGVRCILEPCLSSLIGHLFDCVIVDESQRCKGLAANVTQMLIRLQPALRYCLSATPVSNDVLDLFCEAVV